MREEAPCLREAAVAVERRQPQEEEVVGVVVGAGVCSAALPEEVVVEGVEEVVAVEEVVGVMVEAVPCSVPEAEGEEGAVAVVDGLAASRPSMGQGGLQDAVVVVVHTAAHPAGERGAGAERGGLRRPGTQPPAARGVGVGGERVPPEGGRTEGARRRRAACAARSEDGGFPRASPSASAAAPPPPPAAPCPAGAAAAGSARHALRGTLSGQGL